VAGERREGVATVHSVMEAWDDPGFRQVLNAADLVTPDGMPLVWMLRRLGYPDQQRVYGPDLTLHVCEAAAREGVPVGFYGGVPEALETMVSKLRRLFPGLVVAYAWSPPFRPLTPEEDAQVVREIVESGARVLFVGLGCPKQERWMGEHRGRVPAVMLGVGAAFDFHGGRVRQAPPVDAGAGPGVAVPAGHGAAAPVAAVPEAQPQVCGARSAPAAAGASYPRPRRRALTGAARTLSAPRPAKDETAPEIARGPSGGRSVLPTTAFPGGDRHSARPTTRRPPAGFRPVPQGGCRAGLCTSGLEG